MATKRKTRRRTAYKRVSKEKELFDRLRKTLTALIATVLILVLALTFFGPQIGSFFLLVSRNRNIADPEDIIPPTAPIFSQVPEATNQKNISLNGITEPGATVRIYVNGPEKERTTADNDGSFTFVDLKLGEGNNVIFAKAIDENGNESDKSKVFTIAFDDEKPEIEITTPQDGDEIKNLNRRVLVRGTLSEKADVTINARQAVVKPDNTFELLLGVDEGDVQIKVTATDKAGNKAETVISIKYEKSS